MAAGQEPGQSSQAPLALTMGDPAGIGGDLALALWAAEREALPPFFCLDDPDRLAALARRLGLAVPLAEIAAPAEAPALFPHALPVLRPPVALAAPVEPGRPDPANAPAVVAAIEAAVALVRVGQAAAVVTNPIAKSVLQARGFAFPGHTEFLAHLAGPGADGKPPVPVMMLACPGLRVVPVTVHLSVRAAVAALSREAIVQAGTITAADLRRRFGVAAPRLAVAALNPHAGENGTMGREEIDIIAPAVAELRARGLAVSGPAPADTLFHDAARAGYDACLCMLHDQALIPLKTLDFFGGVNITLGLPFVRTSPDHGTAFALAGSGTADPRSLAAALVQAAALAAGRP